MPPSWQEQRKAMIEHQIRGRGITDPHILEVFQKVERHQFVPPSHQNEAYEDHPVSIGQGQTISQPYIVALMTQLLHIQVGNKILEIGTGSGYQTAILAELGGSVVTIERIEALFHEARQRLASYPSVTCILGDGYHGYPEQAPYDRIILTAAPSEIPQPLIEQLAEGGILVAPIGVGYQKLYKITKESSGKIRHEEICDVIFVPMIPSRVLNNPSPNTPTQRRKE